MKKVLLIDSTPVKQAPYLNIYTSVFDKKRLSWDILTWDKDADGETSYKNHIFTIHRKMHLHGLSKLNDFFHVSVEMRKIISNGQYTHIVVVNTIWALLLIDVLSQMRGHYIIDIRDYKIERKLFVPVFFKKLVSRAFVTVISSNGFRDFLPEDEHIVVSHNISDFCHESREPSLYPGKKEVTIGYVGYVRYNTPNRNLIKRIGGDLSYKLVYYGNVSKYCDFVNDDFLQRNNVYMMGKFENNEKYKIYEGIDIINSLFDSSYASRTLTPNRLYDALLYKKPMIVPAHSYMAKLVKKYQLGLVTDLSENFNIELKSYIDHFDRENFIRNCNQLLNEVKSEQQNFCKSIEEFVKG